MARVFRLVAPVAAILLLGSCGGISGMPGFRGNPPTAHLRATPTRGVVPLEVQIDTSGSRSEVGGVVTRELAVGGGAFEAIGDHAKLLFEEPGSHLLTLRVTDEKGNETTFQATVTAEEVAVESDFRVQVIAPPDRLSAAQRTAFTAAARRWSEVIVGSLPPVTVSASDVERACGAGLRYTGVVDDLLLFADVRPIDGPGGVVGIAGACMLRSDGFPLAGVVVIDADDADFLLASGNFVLVVMHELGHVLDLSHSGWNRRGLLEHDRNSCLNSSRVTFAGSGAMRAYAGLGGSGKVPVEDNGVQGTACSHWHEDVFGNELMTGYLNADSRLSALTIAALGDMGYRVNMGAADDYTLPARGAPRLNSTGTGFTERIVPVGGIVDEDGNFTPLEGSGPVEFELGVGG